MALCFSWFFEFLHIRFTLLTHSHIWSEEDFFLNANNSTLSCTKAFRQPLYNLTFWAHRLNNQLALSGVKVDLTLPSIFWQSLSSALQPLVTIILVSFLLTLLRLGRVTGLLLQFTWHKTKFTLHETQFTLQRTEFTPH